MFRCALVALTLSAGSTQSATPVSAEPFPAQHFSLVPVGGDPLQNGFVEVIHPDGSEVYARQEYVVNGARADQSYAVTILIWTSSPSCVGDPTFVLPAAVLVTNTSGNGTANAAYAPEQLDALGIRGLAIGGDVTLSRDGASAYTTGCKAIQLD